MLNLEMLTPEEATAVHKSIRRNHDAFTGYGHPTAWDFPTLYATYPNLALALRIIVRREAGKAGQS